MNALEAAYESDPYAAIRRLNLRRSAASDPRFAPYMQDGQLAPDFWGRADEATKQAYGEVQHLRPDEWSFGGDWRTGALAPYASKYEQITDLGDGRVSVRMQQPGGHKYDTMDAIYRLDPATGQYVLDGTPQARREVSSMQQMVHDPVDAAAKFVLPSLALYGAGLGAEYLAGGGEAGAAGLDGAIAASADGGALAASGAAPTGASGAAAGVGGGSGAGLMSGWDWVGPALQVGGALLQSRSVDKAADAKRAATEAGIGEQRRQFDLTRNDFGPYRETGRRALAQLETDINAPVTAADVMADPGYAFGRDQGQIALDRKISAMGGRVSGAALKAAARYGTDYATTGYNAAYQRRQDRLNRLAALAGIGQTATGSSAAAGQNSANAISGLISNQGDAAAAARLAQGNIWGNTLNQFGAQFGRKRAQPGMDTGNYDPYGYPNGGP